jgi:hypothetical protein
MYASRLKMRYHLQEKYFLRDNPFSITPSMREVVWANRVEVRRRLEGIFETSLSTSPSRIIINWGDWGSGKTHAMLYFSSELFKRNFQEKLKAKVDFIFCPIHLPRPTVAGSIGKLLFQEILRTITIQRLQQVMALRRKQLIDQGYDDLQARKEIEEYLNNFTRRREFSNIFIRLLGKALELETRFLFGDGLTSSEMRKLGVTGQIESVGDMLDALSLITSVLTQPFRDFSESCLEIFVWIDENEALRDISARDVFIYRSIIRDLLDYAPANVTVLLNFSLSPGQPYSTVEDELGRAVLSRVDENVEFPLIKKANECLDYVGDLLTHFRTSKKKDKFFPFTKETVEYVVSQRIEKGWVPRDLNRAFSKALEIGLVTNRKRIDVNFIKEHKNQILPETPASSG